MVCTLICEVAMNARANTPLNRTDFEQALRAKGAYYHIHHPFHRAMYGGDCSPEQIRGWVANRYYYQIKIPQKDAAIMANCPDASVRRLWLQRILDHDGHSEDRKSTRLNSSHVRISYAVFCLKNKKRDSIAFRVREKIHIKEITFTY